MSFYLEPSQGGDFVPYLKYNAKAGRWYTKNDEPNAEEYEVGNMTAVFDLPNIKIGWFLFAAGMAPEKVYDVNGQAVPKPGEKYKRGFEVMCFSHANIGGVREFSSTANGVIGAMRDLYTAYETAPESKQGKLPVVQCTKVVPVTGKHGTNYTPVFQIVQWVDRPNELTGNQQQANGNGHAAQPAQETVPAPLQDPAPPPAAQPNAVGNPVF